MKKHHLKTPEGELFITLSEQLRFELEAKMDRLWLSGKFKIYFKADIKLELLNDECEIVINCIKNETDDNRSVALTICKAIKVWYGMYYDDRLSVLAKFDSIYRFYYDDKVRESDSAHLRLYPFSLLNFQRF